MEREIIYKIIDNCIKSEEMKQYFLSSTLSVKDLISIILASYLSIDEKIKYLFLLNSQYATSVIKKIYKIISLEENEYFIIYFSRYIEEYSTQKDITLGILNKNKDLSYMKLNYILADFATDGEYSDDDLEYIIVEKWKSDPSKLSTGEFTGECIYFINNEIKFVESNELLFEYRLSERFPNLPYKIGDKITIDMKPFRPKINAEIVDIDSNDYITINTSYKNENIECYLSDIDREIIDTDTPILITSPFINLQYLNQNNQTD